MSRSNDRYSILGVLGSLGWPLIWGLATCSMFYVLVLQGPLDTPAMHRYFATHPVAFCATGMFFVGMAALALKGCNVLGQYAILPRVTLGQSPPEGQRVEDCPALLRALEGLPAAARSSYLGHRLRDVLQFIQRRGTAEQLEDELKYLADLDAARQQDSYALVRIIIWATPMLGFLGTVVGITKALGDLNPEELANSIQTAMEGLLAGLYVAFDTTALALSLAIVLMFVQFLVDRVESQLLATVDHRTNRELSGRFQQLGASGDPHVASIERMSQSVVQATEQLVRQQAELWQGTIDAAHQHWSQLVSSSGQQVQSALAGALDQGLQNHASRLAQAEQEAAGQWQQRYQQWQTALSDNARLLHAQQHEMARQGEVLGRVLEATGEVIKLEQALNRNLDALSGSKNFEDTVMSLSAAIHLLNSRLGQATETGRKVDLNSSSQGRAA